MHSLSEGPVHSEQTVAQGPQEPSLSGQCSGAQSKQCVELHASQLLLHCLHFPESLLKPSLTNSSCLIIVTFNAVISALST